MKTRVKLIGPYPAEFAVRHSMFCYSEVFPSREHVINHMFLVIGNGWKWHKGGLATYRDGDEGHLEEIAKLMRDGRKDAEIWDAVHRHDESDTGHLAQIDREIEELNKRLIAVGGKGITYPRETYPPKPERLTHVYPVCEYSLVMTIPKSVKPDWFALWREAVILARRLAPKSLPSEDPMDRYRENIKWVEKAQWRAAKLGLADKMSK